MEKKKYLHALPSPVDALTAEIKSIMRARGFDLKDPIIFDGERHMFDGSGIGIEKDWYKVSLLSEKKERFLLVTFNSTDQNKMRKNSRGEAIPYVEVVGLKMSNNN